MKDLYYNGFSRSKSEDIASNKSRVPQRQFALVDPKFIKLAEACNDISKSISAYAMTQRPISHQRESLKTLEALIEKILGSAIFKGKP